MSPINSLLGGYNNDPKNRDKGDIKVHNKRVRSHQPSKIKVEEKSVKMKIELDTLARGYKSNSSRITGSNNRSNIVEDKPKIDVNNLTNTLKIWKSENRLNTEDINYIISQLQTTI
tara:strand:+ start:171 stop:518 length:348 start_codon:yes stop_codon:yes gene_type:complete